MKEYLNYNDPFTIASVFETVNKVKKQTNEYNNTCHVCFENILEILD